MVRGTVFAVNVSDGGVPKLPVERAAVSPRGVEGDRQKDLKHHGGPDRAVCLYSLELILALQREGHPISPGSAGENLTIAGLDWDSMTPGRRLGIAGVVLELTGYTTPCNTIRGSFLGAGIKRISQKVNSGWSRVYARVLSSGEVHVGDAVEMLDT